MSNYTASVEVVRQVANTTVGWALGFMLAQTNLLWCRPGDPMLEGAGYGGALAACTVVLLLCVAYLTAQGIRWARRRGYVPVLDSYSLS